MVSEEPLSRDQVLEVLRAAGVIMTGHFVLASGRHSPQFMQLSRVWQYPEMAEAIAGGLAHHVKEQFGVLAFDSICGPAMGGVILGHEMARAFGVRAIYAEKEGEGMAVKRGFQVREGERFLMVEDALTTGGSVRKAMDALRQAGGMPVAVAVAVDRSLGKVDLGVPIVRLIDLDIPSYPEDGCPLCRQGIPLEKPKAVAAPKP